MKNEELKKYINSKYKNQKKWEIYILNLDIVYREAKKYEKINKTVIVFYNRFVLNYLCKDEKVFERFII